MACLVWNLNFFWNLTFKVKKLGYLLGYSLSNKLTLGSSKFWHFIIISFWFSISLLSPLVLIGSDPNMVHSTGSLTNTQVQGINIAFVSCCGALAKLPFPASFFFSALYLLISNIPNDKVMSYCMICRKEIQECNQEVPSLNLC